MKEAFHKICHLTTVHRRNDIRIFRKECKSLSKLYEVFFVVADGFGNKITNEIKIIDVGKENSRFRRIIISPFKVYQATKKINAEIYHFHDPELIPIAMLLKLQRKNIIFDIHENIYEQVKSKEWLPKIFLPIVLLIVKSLNYIVSKWFYLILAEMSYNKIYTKFTQNYINILNYPKIEYLQQFNLRDRIENGIFYIGAITSDRGLYSILDSILILDNQNVKCTVHLIGELTEAIDWEKYPTFKNQIKLYGHLDLMDGYELSKHCKVGLALLKPVGNFIESLPTKMFEYMSIGLPVIASNFNLWESIINDFNCGICVDPEDSCEIAEAINYIFNNPEIAKRMGNNGQKAVSQYFNWANEEGKLFNCYGKLLE